MRLGTRFFVEQSRYRLIWVTFVCILFSSVAARDCYALSVYPVSTEVADYSKKQTMVLTVLNDGPETEEVTMMVDPYSYYLSDYVLIEPREFKIAPNSRRNIEVTLSMPSSLSPERHTLGIMPVTSRVKGQAAEFYFTVPGEAVHDLRILGIKTQNITAGSPIVLDIELGNFGNVIARARPIIEIFNISGIVGVVDYKSVIMVMPYERYNLSIRHEVSSPSEGEYRVAASFAYDSDRLKTDEYEAFFHIEGAEKKASEGFNLFWVVFPAAIMLIGVLFLMRFSHHAFGIAGRLMKALPRLRISNYVSGLFKSGPGVQASHSPAYLHTNEKKRIRDLNRKAENIEKEMAAIVRDIDKFVKASNKWLESKFGAGNYEFR